MAEAAIRSPGAQARLWRWTLLFLLLILAGGAGLTVWEVRRAGRERREELAAVAVRTARALNPRLIAQLSGAENDLTSPAYGRLMGYLAILREEVPNCRFLYLLGRRVDGEIFFFADSEPADSEDYSPPGQVYDEASPKLRRIFSEGRETVEGPLSDRWGIWVSGLAPVTDPVTGQVAAVLGLDIDADDWNRELARAGRPAILLTLILGGLLLVGSFLLSRRVRAGGTAPGRWRRLEPGWAAAFGLTLTVFAALAAQRMEERGRRRFFRQLADAKTDLIADSIRDLRDFELEALTRFFEASQEVTEEEFNLFAGDRTGFPLAHSWLWAPAVPGREIGNFEESVRKRGRPEYRIREPEEGRDTYYPVLYAEPPEVRDSVLGRDLGADPYRRAAMREAAATERAAATAVPRRGEGPDGAAGFSIFQPVYRTGAREVYGFLSANLRPAVFLPPGDIAHFEIFFSLPGRCCEPVASSCPGLYSPDPSLAAGRFLAAFGGVFHLRAHPGPDFFPGFRYRAGAAAALIGLLVTAGLVVLVGAPVEIRERLKREVAERTAELRENRDRYRQLADQTGTYTWEVDATGLYTYVSPVAKRVIGYRPEELVGRKHFYDLHPEAGREEFRESALAVFRRKERFTNLENPVRSRDGRTVWVATSGFPLLDPAGNLAGYRGGDTDISESKLAAAERARLEEQVRQAQKLETVGRLAGGVAHDFNNMLSVIIGFSDLALSKADPDSRLREDLEEIHRAALRSADLTRRLLAFARKQVISPRNLDLNATIEKSLKMLRRLIGEEIELAWRPGPDLPPVRLDPVQVDQVLANLCLNARDALKGTGRIEIETGRVSPGAGVRPDDPEFVPGDYLTLSVSDNGRGMDRETRESIFEPFFTTKEVGKGSGLGLAVVYGIVRQNRGFIEVESEPGMGATFRIYLPRAETDTPAEAEPEPEAVEPSRGRETILAVEDEPANLRLLERMLRNLGYNVLAAADPAEAIRLAGKHPGEIDLLITDVVMPGMNGRELAGRIEVLHPGMRSVFISGYSAEVIGRHGILEEGVRFLQKPIRLKPLAAALREALG